MNHNPSGPDRDELEQKLWEFVYQLLDDAEAAALQQQITSDPVVARRYSEVKQQSELLAFAAQLDEAPLELTPPDASAARPQPAGAAGSAAGGHRGGNWAVALAASLLLALAGYAYFKPHSPLNPATVAKHEARLEAQQPHLAVTAPAVVQAETDNQITVSVTDKAGAPRPSQIEYMVYSTADGRQLIPPQKVETDADGLATISLPGDKLEGPTRVELLASYAGGATTRLSTHLELDEPRFATHLSFDKPLYRPGETVRFRSLTLSRFGKWPIDLTPVDFEILDAGGSPVSGSQLHGVTQQGVGNGWFDIPPGSPGGTYTLVMRSSNGVFPEEQREFQVREYRPPQFKKELELIRDSYAPGDEVIADFAAETGTGDPLAATKVYVQATVDGTPIELPEPQGLTDAQGNYRVKFTLPTEIETGEAVLVVVIDDGATRESIAETIPINLGKVEVEFYPEGGDLAAGLPNRVYFVARDPVGEPVHVEGRVVDSAGQQVAKLETEHEGRGRFSFTPTASDVYTLKIDSPKDVTSQPTLPAARADLPVVLSSNQNVYGSQAPLTLTLHTSEKESRYVVAAMCRGAQVGQMPVADPQWKKVKKSDSTPEHFTANLELPLSDAADGVVRVTLYDYASNPPQPVAERLVYRRPHKQLNVSVGGHSESYSPGAPVDLTLTVTDETGEPTQALLGLSVVDDSLLNLADDKSADMTTHYYLTTEVEQPQDLEDANFFLSAEADAPLALDLLLGVQGWRRFVNLTSDSALAAIEQPSAPSLAELGEVAMGDDGLQLEEQLTRLAELDGTASAPQWLDNAESLSAELAAAKATYYQQRETEIRQFGLILAVAAGVALLVMAVAAFMRWTSGILVWSPAMLTAVACLAVGLLWTRAYIEPSGQVAYQPISFSDDENMVVLTSHSLRTDPETATPESTVDMSAADAIVHEMLAAPMAAMPMEGTPPPPAPNPDAAPLAFGVALEPQAEGEAGGLGGLADLPAKAPLDALFGKPGAAFFAEGMQRGQERGFGNELAKQAQLLQQLDRDKNRNFDQRMMWRQNRRAAQRGGELLEEARQFAVGGVRARLQGVDEKLIIDSLREQLIEQQFPIREYYHKHYSTNPDVREDFQETLCWNPLLVTDADGQARVQFELSDSVTMFKVRVDAHTPASADVAAVGRIGSGEGEVISRIPFRLEPKLPVEVTLGDRIDLPLAVINDSRDSLNVGVELEPSALLTLAGEPHRDVTVDANGRHREWFELNVTGTQGEADLTFRGVSDGGANRLADAVRKTVRVTPTGFPVEQSYAGAINGAQQLTIDLPERWLEGSLEVTLKAFPSTLADMQKGIDSILREPSGCFEQTSSSNYPNIMALQYMQEHDVADPAFTKRAKELLNQGYQKLTTFESPERGYEWFGGNPGHEALTAYGLMEFRDMEQVYDVDDEMVQRTAKWLLDRRNGKGGFSRNQRALDTFGQAPEGITNAYIVWALTESGQQNLATELDSVMELATKSEDPYLIGMAARSALVAGREQAGVDLLEKLTNLQAADGHLDALDSTITRSGGISMQVETTAIAALAWMKHPSGRQSAQKAIEWINGSRQGAGGFGSTQATIMALKALTEYSRANRKTTSAGELIARIEKDSTQAEQPLEPPADDAPADPAVEAPADPAVDAPVQPATSAEATPPPAASDPESNAITKSVAFGAGNSEVIQLEGLEALLKAGKNELTIDLTGDNQMPYVLDIRYRVDKPQSSDACLIRLKAELGSDSVLMGESVPLKLTLENDSGKGQPMTTAIVGIPAGLQVRVEQLDELKKAGKFAYYELNARELVLYWRSLSPDLTGKQKLAFTLDLLAEIPGKYTGPASRVYLYYTAEHKQWLEPLVVEVTRPE